MITINGKENVFIQPDDNICYPPAKLQYSSSHRLEDNKIIRKYFVVFLSKKFHRSTVYVKKL
jgi:hypothetical protein